MMRYDMYDVSMIQLAVFTEVREQPRGGGVVEPGATQVPQHPPGTLFIIVLVNTSQGLLLPLLMATCWMSQSIFFHMFIQISL